MTADPIQVIAEGMTDGERSRAIDRFVESNPHYRGAHWADALDVLVSGDAHLEKVEEIVEEAKALGLVGAVVPYLVAATISRIYAYASTPERMISADLEDVLAFAVGALVAHVEKSNA